MRPSDRGCRALITQDTTRQPKRIRWKLDRNFFAASPVRMDKFRLKYIKIQNHPFEPIKFTIDLDLPSKSNVVGTQMIVVAPFRAHGGLRAVLAL